MKKLSFYLACLVLSLLGALRVEAQNFTNGGFEITTVTIPVDGYTALELNSTWLVGWTVGGPGGGDLAVMDGTTELPPYQGSNWVVFGQGDTAAGASLSQSFATSPGIIYSVAFAVGQAGSAGSPSVSEIVTTTGAAVISSNRCVPAYGVWTPFSFNFTATTTNTTLTFLDTSSTSQGVDVALDGVTVTPQSGEPVITSSPVSVITNAGVPVTFTAGASTTASVQWYFGSTPITGATNTSLTVIAAPTSVGNYSAVFSNSYGTATSAVATLSLIPNLLINGSFELVNGTPIPPGGGMVLNLGATWLTGWTVGGPGGNMEVYNGDNDSLAPYDGQQFVVFNQGDTPVGGILSQTVATTPGENYSLSFVEAETEEGVGPMSVSASVIDGAGVMIVSNQFVAPSTSWTSCQLNFTADSTNTTVVFTDTSSGTEEVDVAMDDAVLTTPMTPTILFSPTNLTVPDNSTAVFSAGATNATFVQWYYGTNAIPGANTGTLSFTASYSSQGNYSAVFSNSFGTVTSAVATLTVTAGPFTNGGFEITTITIPPDNYVVLELDSTWLVGWTMGGPGPTNLAVVDGTTELPPYQGSNWLVFGQGNSPAGASISQTFATSPGYIYDVGFAVGQAGSGGSPSVSEIVTALGGAVISSNLCVPAYGVWTPFSFNFTATTSNSTLTFLDTSSTSVGVDVALDGVTVTPETGPPEIIASPASVTTNAWELVTFSAEAAPTNSAVQWYYGSTPVSAATNTNFTVVATPTSAGDYTVVFSNSFGTATSAVAVLTVVPTLLTNGSFEAVNGTPIPAGGGEVLQQAATWLTGWTVGGPGGNMEVYNGDNDSLAPYDGQQFVVFNQGNTPAGGSLSQTVATTPGETYRLTFVEAETETGVGTMSISASAIGAGGATLASNQFFASSTTWSPCQLNFMADSTNTTIVFTDTSTGTEEVDVAMDAAQLIATPPPTILASPTNLTVSADSFATFTASASNATSIQWYDGANPIAGATSDTLSFIASLSSAGNYSAVFANSYGSITTAVATLTVVAVPFTNGSFEILTGPAIPSGTAENLSFGATWLLGWTGTSGAPEANIEVANGGVDGFSPYQGHQFVIFDANGTPTGGSLSQTFSTAPGQVFLVSFDLAKAGSGSGIMNISPVVTTPSGIILASNLFVAQSSTWSNFQFIFTAETTNTTLAFIDTSTSPISQDVALDNVVVTGYRDTGTPFIIVSPTNQTVAANSQAVFTAIAGGAPSTVQWYQGTNALPGATNGTLILFASDTNAGSYSAVFSNSFGIASTTNAVLAVVDPPVILVSPVSETVSVGGQVSFSASASGSPATSQWFENGAPIPGATNSPLTFSATASSAGVYTATFSNIAGTATTIPATLTVLGIPFTNGGFETVTGGAIPVGTSRTLSLGATWLVGWTPGGLGTNMEVFNGSGDGFSPFEGQQFVIFDPTNAPTGGVLSQAFNTIPGQIYDILFVIAKSGTGAGIMSLTATATANNGDLLASNVCVATSSAWSEFELIFTAQTADTTLAFTDTSTSTVENDLALDDVIVTNLPTNGAPVVVLSPSGLTVNAGQQASLTSLASGAPSSVQWYQDGSIVPAGTNTTLTFTASDLAAGSYWAVFSNSFGSATSEVATVKVIDPAVISTSPASQSVLPGTEVFFSASATGGSSAVQWYHGATALTGATNDLFDVVAGSATAGYYTAVFSNSAGTATTSPAILTVLDLPFTNGSFEIIDRSPLTPGTGGVLAASDTWLTGWTVGGPGGNLEVYNGSVDTLVPFDGQQFVAFDEGNTPTGGSLSQTFSTVPGQTYAVSWVVAKAGSGTGIMSVTATALAADGSLLASNQSIAVSSTWTPFQFGFTATGSNTTLVFTDTSTSTGGADVALDDVALSAQPVLSILVASPKIVLSWPSTTTNFVLQTSSSLTGSWAGVTGGQQTINGNITSWTGPMTTNNAFYRLKSQ